MQPECIIFDFDGVLCDSSNVHKHTLVTALIKCGYAWCDRKESIYNAFQDSKTLFKLNVMVKNNLVGAADVERVCNIKQSLTQDAIMSLKMHPNTFEQVIRLKQTRKLGIASDCDRGTIIAFLGSNNALGLYDALVTSADVGNLIKPSPQVYIRAMELLQVTSDQVIVFEDTMNGLNAAALAGIFQAHKCTYHNLPDKLLRYT